MGFSHKTRTGPSEPFSICMQTVVLISEPFKRKIDDCEIRIKKAPLKKNVDADELPTKRFRRAFIAHAEMLITHAIGQCLDKFSVVNGQQNHNQSKCWVVVEV